MIIEFVTDGKVVEEIELPEPIGQRLLAMARCLHIPPGDLVHRAVLEYLEAQKERVDTPLPPAL
jgi:hypothetical protein